MILLEEAIDIQERHWRLHWMLNLAQFQASITFESILIPLIGEQHKPLVGRILISDEDRNWDSVRELWTLKENVKTSAALKRAFDDNETADGVMRALGTSEAGRVLLQEIDKYKNEYGNKSMYAHEYLYTTWRENPTPIVEVLRGYLVSDYDYEKDVRQLRANRDAAIKEMWSLVPAGTSQEDKDKLKTALDLALKMTPLTPDHHFYMDQGKYARMRLVLMGVGRKLVELGGLAQPDDIMFLKYDELRTAQCESVVRRQHHSSRNGETRVRKRSRSARGSGPALSPTGRCTASRTSRSSGTGREFTSVRRLLRRSPPDPSRGLAPPPASTKARRASSNLPSSSTRSRKARCSSAR